ncbi:MAG TPA: beta-galactosidase [Ktedonobacterales bacterium]
MLGADLRLANSEQPFNDSWARVSIAPRGETLLGISFRPRNTEALGLQVRPTLTRLLQYPIEMVRLGAYWNRIEPAAGIFDTSELDWQLDTVEQAGAKIVLSVGAMKTFGFPEYFIPRHYLPRPFPDGALITTDRYSDLLDRASEFVTRIVDRYKSRRSIVAWQLENEPVDPLPFAHYWRLSTEFVRRELEALRNRDMTRPVMINGSLPTAASVRVGQAWLTRDQGDSLAFAKVEADIIGVDYYPRVAVTNLGEKTLYIDSTGTPWGDGDRESLAQWANSHGKRIMVAEGQAEPWETSTVPPSPRRHALYSCTPTDLIQTYNSWAQWTVGHPLYAYLFWGADYWVRRAIDGDDEYFRAFARILEEA